MKKKKIVIGVIVVLLIAAVIALVIFLGGESIDDAINKGNTTTTKPKCPHDDPSQIVIKKAIEPTCMGPGLTEGKQCKKCGTMISVQKPIYEIDCIEGEWVVELEPTETEDGYECTRCVMCGDIINERVIPAGTEN